MCSNQCALLLAKSSGMNENVGQWDFRCDDDGTGDVLRLLNPEEVGKKSAENETEGARFEGCDGHTEDSSGHGIYDKPGKLEYRDDARKAVELVLVFDL